MVIQAILRSLFAKITDGQALVSPRVIGGELQHGFEKPHIKGANAIIDVQRIADEALDQLFWLALSQLRGLAEPSRSVFNILSVKWS